jgi:hypothetical protein
MGTHVNLLTNWLISSIRWNPSWKDDSRSVVQEIPQMPRSRKFYYDFHNTLFWTIYRVIWVQYTFLPYFFKVGINNSFPSRLMSSKWSPEWNAQSDWFLALRREHGDREYISMHWRGSERRMKKVVLCAIHLVSLASLEGERRGMQNEQVRRDRHS